MFPSWLSPWLLLTLVAESALEKERSKINQGYKLLGKQAWSGKFEYEALAKAIAERHGLTIALVVAKWLKDLPFQW